MAYVTVINEHQHLQQIVSGHHHLTADEPVAAERRLSFARALSAAQKSQLLQVAESTPVTSVLRAGIVIQSAIVD